MIATVPKTRASAVLSAACLLAMLVSLLLGGGADRAGAGQKSQTSKKKLAGKYTGQTQEGGTVSFTLTRTRKIVGFELTNATVYCYTVPEPTSPGVPPRPRPPHWSENPRLVPVVTAPPIPMQEVSKSDPLGRKFLLEDRRPSPNPVPSEGIYVDGKKTAARIFAGNVVYGTNNGPEDTPGTEICVTKFIDWFAKKAGPKK